MLATTVIQKERFDLIRQVRVTQSIKVSAWVARFINNCQKNKKGGPLKTLEIQFQVIFLY